MTLRSMGVAQELETVTVHVAGPTELEKVGNRTYVRQRCLRCDGLLRDEREHLAWWLLGQRIGSAEDGRLRVIEHQRLRDGETDCVSD